MNNTNNTNNLNEIVIKQLVGTIYSKVDLSKFRYEMIRYENDLQKLLRQRYHIMLNYCGTNCLMVFTKIKDKFFSFTVDRQTISYNFNKIDFSNVNLNLRNINLSQEIYEGTVFEGILIKQHGKLDTYMICDCYSFCGEDFTEVNLIDKLNKINTYLEKNYTNSPYNNIILELNKIYTITDIEIAIADIDKTQFKCRGLCFYPDISETKLVFLMTQIEDNRTIYKRNELYSTITQNNNSTGLNNTNTKQKYITKPNKFNNRFNDKIEDIIFTLEIVPTNFNDVYQLYACDMILKDNKPKYKKYNIGIADIQTNKIYTLVKNITQHGSKMMKCKYDTETQKWVPIEEDMESKRPSLISNIRKLIEDI